MKYTLIELDLDDCTFSLVHYKEDREVRAPCVIPLGNKLLAYVPETESVEAWKNKLLTSALEQLNDRIGRLEDKRAKLLTLLEHAENGEVKKT